MSFVVNNPLALKTEMTNFAGTISNSENEQKSVINLIHLTEKQRETNGTVVRSGKRHRHKGIGIGQKTRFLIDTGADIRVCPHSRLLKPHAKSTYKVSTINGTVIIAYGTVLALYLGL